MPNWPQEGSVVDVGDYIVVKLSENQWPEEILDSEIYETTAPNIDETLKYSVDSVQITDGTLSIRGWMIQEGVLSDSLPHICRKKHQKMLSAFNSKSISSRFGGGLRKWTII